MAPVFRQRSSLVRLRAVFAVAEAAFAVAEAAFALPESGEAKSRSRSSGRILAAASGKELGLGSDLH
jgi:hypothetical protein